MTVLTPPQRSPRSKRDKLFRRFEDRIEQNGWLDRSLVSFQANRTTPVLRWFKYKEGFSAELVHYLINKLTRKAGVLLDPFAGAGTAPFCARSAGWKALGIELLPVGFFAMQTRLAAERTNPETFQRFVEEALKVDWISCFEPSCALRHIPITAGAFPEDTDKAIGGFRGYCESIRNPHVRTLFSFACMSILEEVSYTRKDGQYLRWDRRAKSRSLKSEFDKGVIPPFGDALAAKLRQIHGDLIHMREPGLTLFGGNGHSRARRGDLDMRAGSSLEILPSLDDKSVDLVITSPPYCNRYDYTRTYALELVYLGNDADAVKQLRQRMLSCTVENRAKESELHKLYEKLGVSRTYERILSIFGNQEALHEVLGLLEAWGAQGLLNNPNVPQMVRNYFLEMSFIICELSRILRRGGKVVMINDNVRYAGEEVPVDLILSNIAEQFGLSVKCIWTLARGKGNSSQQMGAHGRTELRKCVYVWEKP